MSFLFERLQQLEDILYFPETRIDITEFFKWEFQFLDYYLRLQSFMDEPNMLQLTLIVQTLLHDALADFSELYLADYFDFYTSKVKSKILLTKMEIRSRYSFPNVSLPISVCKDDVAIPKFITEFIHSIAESLPELVKIDDDPYSLVHFPETTQHVNDVLKELKLLRNFSCFVSDRFIGPQMTQHQVNFFTHVLAVAGHAAMLAWLYLPDLAPEEINVLLSDFLQTRIKPIQPNINKIYVDVLQSSKSIILQPGWCPHIQNELAEVNILETILHHLMELPTNSNSSQIGALKDHLVILQKMLNLLRANINRVSMQDLEFLQDIDTAIIDAGLLVYSLYDGEVEKKEVMAHGEMNKKLVLELMGKIQHTNTLIYLTIRKAFRSNLPRIHGLGYVDFLLNNLKEFQSRHSDSLASFANQLQVIEKELGNLQPFLEAIADERHNDPGKSQRCATQLIGKAYEVEYIVHACIRNEAPSWCLERWFLDIIEEITLIRAEVAEIHEKKIGDATNTVIPHASSNLARSPRMNEEIVGFEEVTEKLRNQLIKGTKERDVISIVGMPGLGKTTLGNKLYYDELVISHFDIRAQCCVSQVYSREDLLLVILGDVVGKNSGQKQKRADELANELRKGLFSRRYLILVDDVWETSAWDDLRACFPDNDNGSRIILTTRNHEVSNYARVQSEPLPLRMFSDDESWELLRKKVFGEESCPPLLMNIGQQIAKKCGGSPLSVVLAAGILAEMEKKEECWEQVANNLGSHIHNDSRAIIEQSYQILPYHLSCCFLYFGAFLEDDKISVSKLIRLWISEGFIKSREGKSLEDIAEGYLENLIGRNLVMRTKKSYRGKTKACQIHDLLHDFCKERAKEENLLLLIKWDQSSKSSTRVDFCKQLAPRMSIYGEGCDHIGEWRSCWSRVGSVILHINCLPFDFGFHILHTFKFLKVLDLGFTDIGSFPTKLDLVYLRYFSAYIDAPSFLSSTTVCWNLETLLLSYNSEGLLPITLWDMVKLRHLHIGCCNFTVENAEESLENSKKLDGLKTLSAPCFSCVQDLELILRKTPNLEELRCQVDGTFNFEYCVSNFPTRLEMLEIQEYVATGLGYRIFPFCISAPNLTSLTVERFYLHPRHISEIGLLHNLQVLKLQCINFWKKGWKVRDVEFPQLKVLKLSEVNFHGKWTVADDAFPNLENLVLHSCNDLKTIPSCFEEISSLKSIKVEFCWKSVSKSARDIKETQVEVYQNSGFQVLIINEKGNNSSDDEEDNDEDDDFDDTTLDCNDFW